MKKNATAGKDARRFRATVLAGHKQDALEVPFDPAEVWALETVAIETGRRGYPVRAVMRGETFDSHVVARSKRFWLLLEPERLARAGVAIGDEVDVSLQPG